MEKSQKITLLTRAKCRVCGGDNYVCGLRVDTFCERCCGYGNVLIQVQWSSADFDKAYKSQREDILPHAINMPRKLVSTEVACDVELFKFDEARKCDFTIT